MLLVVVVVVLMVMEVMIGDNNNGGVNSTEKMVMLVEMETAGTVMVKEVMVAMVGAVG